MTLPDGDQLPLLIHGAHLRLGVMITSLRERDRAADLFLQIHGPHPVASGQENRFMIQKIRVKQFSAEIFLRTFDPPHLLPALQLPQADIPEGIHCQKVPPVRAERLHAAAVRRHGKLPVRPESIHPMKDPLVSIHCIRQSCLCTQYQRFSFVPAAFGKGFHRRAHRTHAVSRGKKLLCLQCQAFRLIGLYLPVVDPDLVCLPCKDPRDQKDAQKSGCHNTEGHFCAVFPLPLTQIVIPAPEHGGNQPEDLRPELFSPLPGAGCAQVGRESLCLGFDMPAVSPHILFLQKFRQAFGSAAAGQHGQDLLPGMGL